MKRTLVSALAILLFCMEGFTQQALPPFVTDIEARTDGATIRVTWKDSDEQVASYLVFRDTEEITSETLDQATLVGEVSPGTMLINDSPDDTQTYFYAVVASDKDGNYSTELIEFRNKTESGKSIDEKSLLQSKPVDITDLSASLSEGAVYLRFETSNSERDVAIYRSTDDISESEDLVDAILLDTVSSSTNTYIDYPVPGLSYYYALFDSELLRVGKQRFNLGKNVLTDPVELPPSVPRATSGATVPARSRPLPYLILSTKVESGKELSASSVNIGRRRKALTPEAQNAVSSLIPADASKIKQFDKPVFLAPETNGSDSRNSQLKRIVDEYISKEKWDEGRSELEKYLQIRHSEDELSRAHYYLGQAYYFTESFRNAFIHFLYASESYYAEAQTWMDNILLVLHERDS